jgi:DNA-binding NarL/FixJ family response regulator
VNGVEATRQVLAQDDSIKVLGLSMHADAAFVAEMLQAGAVGYLLKDCAFDELVNAVRAVVGGQTYLSPTITGSLVESYVRRPARPAAAAAPLGSKDRELVRMLAEGLSVEEIAKKRRTQAKAVDSQRIQVMERLGLRNIADLVKYAIREGLTRLD